MQIPDKSQTNPKNVDCLLALFLQIHFLNLGNKMLPIFSHTFFYVLLVVAYTWLIPCIYFGPWWTNLTPQLFQILVFTLLFPYCFYLLYVLLYCWLWLILGWNHLFIFDPGEQTSHPTCFRSLFSPWCFLIVFIYYMSCWLWLLLDWNHLFIFDPGEQTSHPTYRSLCSPCCLVFHSCVWYGLHLKSNMLYTRQMTNPKYMNSIYIYSIPKYIVYQTGIILIHLYICI